MKKNKYSSNQQFFSAAAFRQSVIAAAFFILCTGDGYSQEITREQQTDTAAAATQKNPVPDSLVNYSRATYPGGDAAWTRYIMQHLVLPDYNKKFEGSIIVSFTVAPSGKLENIQASEGPKPMQREAIRVVKNSGRWIPAYKGIQPISSVRQQKISFYIDR